MPFQPINFAAINPLGKPWARDFADNLRKGMETYNTPQKLLSEQEQRVIANAFNKEKTLQEQAVTPFAAEKAQTDIRLKQGQAMHHENMNRMPYGGLVTGDVGQDLALHMILNDPNASAELKKSAEEGRRLLLRQRAMANTPEATKLREDEQRIMNDPNMSYQDKQDAIGFNRAKNIKNSIIPEIEVQKTRADITAEGFEKLLQPEMLEALTQYSGTEGTLKRGADEWQKWWTGKTPERLLMYEDAESTAEGVAMNLRAAIKESVSPKKGEQILDMISPANLKRSPEQAVRRLKAAAEFFEIERRGIYKGTGRTLETKGGAHNESLNNVNRNAQKIDNKKGKNLNVNVGKGLNLRPDWEFE